MLSFPGRATNVINVVAAMLNAYSREYRGAATSSGSRASTLARSIHFVIISSLLSKRPHAIALAVAKCDSNNTSLAVNRIVRLL
jgi:hypothetical protein